MVFVKKVIDVGVSYVTLQLHRTSYNFISTWNHIGKHSWFNSSFTYYSSHLVPRDEKDTSLFYLENDPPQGHIYCKILCWAFEVWTCTGNGKHSLILPEWAWFLDFIVVNIPVGGAEVYHRSNEIQCAIDIKNCSYKYRIIHISTEIILQKKNLTS